VNEKSDSVVCTAIHVSSAAILMRHSSDVIEERPVFVSAERVRVPFPASIRYRYASTASLARISLFWQPAPPQSASQTNSSGNAFGVALPSMILPLVAIPVTCPEHPPKLSIRPQMSTLPPSIRLLRLRERSTIVWIVCEKVLDSPFNTNFVHGRVVTKVEARPPHLYFALLGVEISAFQP
jgi:hypothetical protein